MTPKISICIPFHDTPETALFLSRLFKSLHEQTFKDYEILVIKEGLVGHNLNEGIKKSKGELIKIMCQDDWFAHENSLKDIVDNFKGNWLISGSHNNLKPEWTDNLHTGFNKLGGLSSMTLKNENLPLFDESLEWMVDIDFYLKMKQKFGLPTILEGLNINIGIHENQATNKLSYSQKALEKYLTIEKYAGKY